MALCVRGDHDDRQRIRYDRETIARRLDRRPSWPHRQRLRKMVVVCGYGQAGQRLGHWYVYPAL